MHTGFIKVKESKENIVKNLFYSLYFLALNCSTFIDNQELSHIVNSPYQIVFVDSKELLLSTVVCLVVLNHQIDTLVVCFPQVVQPERIYKS